MSLSPRKGLVRACALLVILIPLVLCSCFPTRDRARETGRALVDGGFDAAEAYLNSPAGQVTIAKATERTLEAGTAKVGARLDGLIESLDPKIGPMGVAIAKAGVEMAKPYIGEAVDGQVGKLEAKRDELQAKKDAGTATPWEGILLSLVTAILTGYAAYQRGNRTGEDKGWKDAGGTGDGSAPKT